MTPPDEGEATDAPREDRERVHREIDEALTDRVERFLAELERRPRAFPARELADAVAIPRFDEREAHRFLVALLGQSRVHHDHAGWHQGQPPR